MRLPCIARRLKKRWATAGKTLPMIFQNHGQRFLKRWAMFFKTTGNENSFNPPLALFNEIAYETANRKWNG